MGKLELKIPCVYLDLLNRATFSEGVECVFGFTEKCFSIACDDLNHVPIEGLGLKPLRVHLEYANDIYIQKSVLIDENFVLTLF